MSILAPQMPAMARKQRWSPGLLMAAMVLLPLPAAAGDVVRGAVLAAPCASCHGTDGHSPGAIPSIDLLAMEDMTRALLDFRSGSREATVMNRIARGYDVPEIEAIAAYFAAKSR